MENVAEKPASIHLSICFVLRLDFNGFYTTAIDQFKSTPGMM